jgi:RNA polymerase sigma-70 factor, ECF subfamily
MEATSLARRSPQYDLGSYARAVAEPIPAAAFAARPEPEADDEALALAARTDSAAFAKLYERQFDRVFRYVRSRVPDDDTAEDLTAVTFERALGAIGRYRHQGAGIAAWLLRIARNATIDAARRDRRPRSLDMLPEMAHPLAPGSPEDTAIAGDRLRRLATLVARLPDAQREALALRYGGGLTGREISAVIGRSESATKKLLARALQALREADQ